MFYRRLFVFSFIAFTVFSIFNIIHSWDNTYYGGDDSVNTGKDLQMLYGSDELDLGVEDGVSKYVRPNKSFSGFMDCSDLKYDSIVFEKLEARNLEREEREKSLVFEDSAIYSNEGDDTNSLDNSTVDDTNYVSPFSYSSYSREIMLWVVEGEAHDGSLKHKRYVSCVIANRVLSSRFSENTLEGVLMAKNQFTAINNYTSRSFKPDEDTIKAVDEVLSGEINSWEFSNGALFFYNPKYSGYLSYFERKPFLFEIEGHRFFA